ncbi:GNAT family N-acetyltransferase [Canibacter zhoujuaniae]|uniref:GNAT family N-acetyltransferase n=1 Tax=Canibacter zhoujuaniae TaxID=2708343 RepID=UPI001424528E|nr:GNAT family N-acetyltransferase [Canibacter zhoujuaniae]
MSVGKPLGLSADAALTAAAAAGELDLSGFAPAGFKCRQLVKHADLKRASQLYTEVFKYSDATLFLNPYLLSALSQNGGSTVGVFAGRDLIGFAYGFPAVTGGKNNIPGTVYHYSQAAVVAESHHGAGIGKALKLAQAEVARAWGCTEMRWTFDPKLTRNARFNFNGLGATGIAYLDDYYRTTNSDRILVSWDLSAHETGQTDARTAALKSLRSEYPPELTALNWAFAAEIDAHELASQNAVASACWVPVPANLGSIDNSNDPAAPDPEHIAQQLRATLTALFADGYQLIACNRREDTAAYLAVKWRNED